MSQRIVVSAAYLKGMLRSVAGNDYNESLVIALQKVLDAIQVNEIERARVSLGEEDKGVHSTWSPTETTSASPGDEILILLDNSDPIVAEARRTVQGCLHSAIYDLYVYRNHTKRCYSVLFHVGGIAPSEVAVLGKKGVKVESFRIAPFSDEIWSVHFDFDFFV